MNLARSMWRGDHAVRRRLNLEAVELLRKALQLADNRTREARCWYDLARTLDSLRDSNSEIEAAFLRARSLLPEEPRFTDAYEAWKSKRQSSQRRQP